VDHPPGCLPNFRGRALTFGQTWSSFHEVAKVLPLTGALRTLRDPREEHYLHLAEDILSLGRSSVPLTGLPVPALSLPAPLVPGSLLGAQGLLDDAYRKIRLDYPVPSLFGGDPALAYYTALNVPSAAASLVAQAAPSGPVNSYFSTLVGSQAAIIWRAREYKNGKVTKDFQEEAIKEEAQKRAGVVASATAFSLASPSARGLGPWLWANPQQPPQESRERPLEVDPPLNYVSPNGLRFAVREEATRDLADKLLRQDLSQLVEDLKKKSNDREAFEKVLREARKHRPWWDDYTGKTREPVDKYTFMTAPELLPLRTLLGISPAQATEEHLQARDQFFDAKESKLYDPQGGDELIWWKTQVSPATTPSWGDPGVRQEVVEAWQMIEAGKVAQQEARRIRDRIDGKNADEALKDLRKIAKEHPSWGNLIRLEDVARQVPKPDTQQRPEQTYEPYKVPHDEMPYPPENFADRLLELNEHQAGFLLDRPEKHVYVVYVEKRSPPPSVEQVVEARRRELENEKLWKDTKTKRQKEYQELVLRELRREAGKLNAEGRFELRPGIRAEEGGSDREGYTPD